MKAFKIVIIGAGNLAQHLANAFSKAPVNIVQVFNHRSSTRAKALARRADAEFVSDYSKLVRDADIYLLCVKDEAIHEVVRQLKTLSLKGTVLHTSGSTDISVLQQASTAYGVFYPLQTLSPHDVIDWKGTPVLVEGNTAKAASQANKLAALISGKVVKCSSADRLKIHLAAVLACNFSNALYALAYDLMKAELPGKSFDLLKPLIRQTARKIDKLSPGEAQTGPARRGDKAVIKKHLALLKDHPEIKAVYQLMTKTIEQRRR